MSRLEKVERDVLELTPGELALFREWFIGRENALWDQQFEKDVESGKLDVLGEQARRDRVNGLMTEL